MVDLGAIAVAVTFGALIWYHHRSRLEAARQTIAFLAARRGGTVAEGVPDWGAFGASWQHELLGESCRLYFHSTGGKSPTLSTRFEFNARPGLFPRIEVYPQSPVHAIAKLLGMQDIEIGIKSFDDAYILKAESETRLKSFLDAGVRSRIERVDSEIPGAMYLRGASEVFELRVDSWLTQEHIVSFLDAAVALAKAMMDRRDDQVPAAPEPRSTPTRSSCPICAKPLAAGLVVRCRKCKTPHHSSCWDHNGTCSVYGCTGILFDR